MFELLVPTIGESITTAFVATWRKKPGDWVAEGETVLDLDSDKASLEVPSPRAGRLVEQLHKEGDEVLIGAALARLDEDAEAPAAAAPAAVAPAAVAPAAAAPAAVAPAAAVPAAPAAVAPAAPTPAAPAVEEPPGRGAQTGPAARQMASKRGVDLLRVEGTGKKGRILSRDVEAAAREPAPTAPPPSPAPTPFVLPAPGHELGDARVERVPMTPLRRTIARRLVQAQQTAAMLTTFNEVDLSQVMALRKRHQERFVERHGLKLGFMSFFVKAAVEALKEFPAANAEIDETDPERPAILYKRYYHIGVAVSTERGLMVPVVRDADRLGFAELEKAIAELALRGRDGKLRLEDFQDGTFTISNGGVFGSLLSTPILNPPQVAILGMHSIQERPMGVGGQILLRPMMYLALSYDHRIIDGREAVGFLKRIKELVEEPERLLLEL